ncbi:MAG: hypothetical protein CVV27_02665 [Candidatus Melainabacteria bacterium HGW-Melainabacteria-1]|nr:MAG: hypothetical protein CVV27_02665 [Candidatus Melainabacteria bacterium HGW-Melainabacteria-1]
MSYEFLAREEVELAKWRKKICSPGFNLKFSDVFAQKGFKWCGGKFFQIQRTVVVPYSASYILPAADYKDVVISNVDGGLKLYPDAEGKIYEILVGFKPGNYHTILYIPPGKYFLALGASTMFPDVADAEKKYLGAIIPDDSPADDPAVKLWAIKDYDGFTLRFVVLDGVGFEKVVAQFYIAKHQLVELKEAPQVYTEIKFHEEISGIW